MKFAKGRGTGEACVLLLDMPAALELTPTTVVTLCDLRNGIGGDSLIRVTVAGSAREAGLFDDLPNGVSADDWFLDHRNADGTVVPLCGNALRVLAHHLWATGLERRRRFMVGTLAGARSVEIHAVDEMKADVSVEMGRATRVGVGEIRIGDRPFAGMVFYIDGQHLACVDPTVTIEELAALDLAAPVRFDSGPIRGAVTVELSTAELDGLVHMRIHQFGFGATRCSDGGSVATAAATLARAGNSSGRVAIRTPGGDVDIQITETTSYLRGPSLLVAHGETTRQSHFLSDRCLRDAR